PYPHLPHACLSSCPPRAHRSTLFPYTTLFRSHAFAQTRLGQSQRPARRRKTAVLDDGGKKVQVVQILHGAGHGLHGVSVREQSRDRKSTRLNSSHVSISYAVFCLKKKKTT